MKTTPVFSSGDIPLRIKPWQETALNELFKVSCQFYNDCHEHLKNWYSSHFIGGKLLVSRKDKIADKTVTVWEYETVNGEEFSCRYNFRKNVKLRYIYNKCAEKQQNSTADEKDRKFLASHDIVEISRQIAFVKSLDPGLTEKELEAKCANWCRNLVRSTAMNEAYAHCKSGRGRQYTLVSFGGKESKNILCLAGAIRRLKQHDGRTYEERGLSLGFCRDISKRVRAAWEKRVASIGYNSIKIQEHIEPDEISSIACEKGFCGITLDYEHSCIAVMGVDSAAGATMRIPFHIGCNDKWMAEVIAAMKNSNVVKVSIKRVQAGPNKYKYFVQFIVDGVAPRKDSVNFGSGQVGIDNGTGNIVFSTRDGEVQKYEPWKDDKLREYDRRIAAIQRKLDKIDRKSNPGAFNEDGTPKRSVARVHTREYRRQEQLANKWRRKKSEYRKNECGRQFNRVFAKLGDVFVVESTDDAAWKRQKGNGGGGHGKTIQNCAGAEAIDQFERICKKYGKHFYRVDTFMTRATQFDPSTLTFEKHEEKERELYVGGHWVDRDEKSAFNLANIKEDKLSSLNKTKKSEKSEAAKASANKEGDGTHSKKLKDDPAKFYDLDAIRKNLPKFLEKNEIPKK